MEFLELNKIKKRKRESSFSASVDFKIQARTFKSMCIGEIRFLSYQPRVPGSNPDDIFKDFYLPRAFKEYYPGLNKVVLTRQFTRFFIRRLQ